MTKNILIIFIFGILCLLLPYLISRGDILSYLLLFGIIGVFLFYFVPKIVIILYALLPIVFRWITGDIRFLGGTTSLTGAIRFIFIGLAIVYILIHSRRLNDIWKNVPGFIYLVIFSLTSLILIIFSNFIEISIKTWIRHDLLFIIFILVFYIILYKKGDLKFIEYVLTFLIVFFIIVNIILILEGEHIRYIEQYGQKIFRYDYGGIVTGDTKLGVGANTMGSIAAMFLPFLFAQIFIYKGTKKYLFFILALGCLGVLISTTSRAPFIALLLSSIIVGFSLKKSQKYLLFFIIILSILPILSIISILVKDTLYSQSNSLNTRIFDIWLPAVSSIINDKLIIGDGIGSFNEFTYSYLGKVQSPHNTIIEYLFERGFIAVFVYLLFLYKIIQSYFSNINKISVYKDKILMACYFSGIFTWIITSMSCQVNQQLFYQTISFYLIGIAIVIKKNNNSVKRKNNQI